MLLTLAVLFGLVVPFDVFAEEEEPATGSDIHAMLYYIDPNKTTQSGSIDITKNLEKVDLTCWNLPNLENAGNTFNGCSVLTDVNISNWTIPKATYIPGIFANCTSLETIDLSSFKITYVILYILLDQHIVKTQF